MDHNHKIPENNEIDDLKTLLQRQQRDLEDLQKSTQGQFTAILTMLQTMTSAKTSSSALVESSSFQDVQEKAPAEGIPPAPADVGNTKIQGKTSSSASAELSSLPEAQETQAEVLSPASADADLTETKPVNPSIGIVRYTNRGGHAGGLWAA